MTVKTETQSISLEYDLPHPPAKVWRAEVRCSRGSELLVGQR